MDHRRSLVKRGHIVVKPNQSFLITTMPRQDDSLINAMLPNELILRVFSYLDMITLCKCAQVCHLWHSLALDGSNWQSVDLFTFQRHIKAQVLDSLARRCGGFLKELSLKGCENIHDSALRSFTARCANIEVLSLHKCKRVTDATCENLGKHCHKLIYLNLDNCTSVTDRSMRYISDGCKLLEYLNISWCDNISDKGVQMVVHNCEWLKTLVVKGCDGLTENVFDGIEDNMRQLTTLNMQNCYVTDHTLAAIATGSPQMERICLSNCNLITDRGLTVLAKGCRHLLDLELAACTMISDAGAMQVAKNCPSLQRVDMEDCTLITDTTITCLSTHCPRLASLTLSHCELLTDAAIHILCSNQKDVLEVLELDNCPLVSDGGLFHLRCVSTLSRLDIYDCQGISKEGVQRFKQHRPQVEVHAYFAPSTPPAPSPPIRNAICRCCSIL